MQSLSTIPKPLQFVDDQKCVMCHNTASMRYDYHEGSIVCIQCGYVAQQNFIDYTQEWRNFSEGNQSGTDPRRAGGPLNGSLEDGGMGTMAGGKVYCRPKPLQNNSA